VDTPPLRILLVEDNADAAESLRRVLALSGHQVTLAHDGPAGLAAARHGTFDVILCDLGLPGMSGFTMAGVLRGYPGTANAHLIAVSGHGSEADQRRCREAGFDRHLTKPVDPGALQEILAALPARPGPAPVPEDAAE
jgi:CheY-like chemotaxis protein